MFNLFKKNENETKIVFWVDTKIDMKSFKMYLIPQLKILSINNFEIRKIDFYDTIQYTSRLYRNVNNGGNIINGISVFVDVFIYIHQNGKCNVNNILVFNESTVTKLCKNNDISIGEFYRNFKTLNIFSLGSNINTTSMQKLVGKFINSCIHKFEDSTKSASTKNTNSKRNNSKKKK